MLLGDDGFFGGVHAANRGAIIPLRIARTHALDESDALGLLLVVGAKHAAGKRSGGGKDALELQSR
jgi:hypothetical protein